MRFRCAKALLLEIGNGELYLHQFLRKLSLTANYEAVSVLGFFAEYRTAEEALAHFANRDGRSVLEQMQAFTAQGLLVVEDSEADRYDTRVAQEWPWSINSAFFHFSERDLYFQTADESIKMLEERLATSTAPPLWQDNSNYSVVTHLPAFDTSRNLFDVITRRRSRRHFSGESISQQELADVLFAGKGIVALAEDDRLGILPLATTPSGGARNPFELYVLARKVEGLSAGVYHYSGIDHTLGFISDATPDLAPLMGNQSWTTATAAVILLVANLERPAWKYQHSGAYRVVLIEAGAIAQNMLLAATEHALSIAPTGALAESKLEAVLGIDNPAKTVIFAVVLGKTDEEKDREALAGLRFRYLLKSPIGDR